MHCVLGEITPLPFTMCIRNTSLDIFRYRICLFCSLILSHYDAPAFVVLIHDQMVNSQLVWYTGILVLSSCPLQPSAGEIVSTKTSVNTLNTGGSHKTIHSKPFIKQEMCVDICIFISCIAKREKKKLLKKPCQVLSLNED